MINGHYCHETGCPDSHLFVKRECPWCGTWFYAEERGQKFCGDSCYRSYNDYPDEESYPEED